MRRPRFRAFAASVRARPIRSSAQGRSERRSGFFNAIPHYDISAVAITYGEPSRRRLGGREVKALWLEYGSRWTESRRPPNGVALRLDRIRRSRVWILTEWERKP